uniref:Uncharacterized protein n=1 Tax=Zea mays TaxID=4577 RepID=A0A804NGL6_MAIZE
MLPSWTARVDPAAHEVEAADGESGLQGMRPTRRSTEKADPRRDASRSNGQQAGHVDKARKLPRSGIRALRGSRLCVDLLVGPGLLVYDEMVKSQIHVVHAKGQCACVPTPAQEAIVTGQSRFKYIRWTEGRMCEP